VKKLLAFILLFGGCSSVDLDKEFIKPIDANIYENLVQYECNGKWEQSIGVATCQYPEQSILRFKIKVPPTKGQVVVKSCLEHKEVDFHDDDSFVEMEWPIDDYRHSCPIVMSVAGRDSGIQLFKFTPYIYTQDYPEMQLQFNYWNYQQGVRAADKGSASSQQPVSSRFYSSFTVDQARGGKYIVSSTCLINKPGQKITEFPAGTKSFEVEVTKETKGFCPVSIAIKYDDDEAVEAELYLDWFDPKYIPLSPPIFKSKKKACVPLGYRFFEFNGKQYRRGIFSRECKKRESDKPYAIGWTKIGRMSYAEKKLE